MAYTTEDKVLHRAKLAKSDVHTSSETAIAIISECMEDADAQVDFIMHKSVGWQSSDPYYKAFKDLPQISRA
jgi:hypothetical protein